MSFGIYRGQSLGPDPKMEPFEGEMIRLPRGLRVQRTAPNICDQATKPLDSLVRQDNDTGKTGNYFATQPFLALAITYEYKTNLQIAEFVLTEDLQVPFGKYAQRNIHPERQPQNNFKLWPKDLVPDENVDHLDNNILPLRDYSTGDTFFHEESQVHVANQFHGELFLTANSVKSLQFLKSYQIHAWDTIDEIFQEVDQSPASIQTVSFWMDKEVLTEIKC